MQQLRWVFVLAMVTCLLVQCGDDDDSAVDTTVGPGSGSGGNELIGSWRFESTNLIELSTERLVDFLEMLGTAEEDIEANVTELQQEFAGSEDFFERGDIITFRADNTWEGSDGDNGTWSATEGELQIEDAMETASNTSFSYSISANQLTLVWTKEQLQKDMLKDEEIDAETMALFGLMLMEDDEFEFVFTWVE